jgi:nucleoside-diphosphate-sugar epimerase
MSVWRIWRRLKALFEDTIEGKTMGNEPKPIFVTGATGSIGYMLAKRLSDNGLPVRVLARDVSRARNLKTLAGVEVVAGDLGQPESLHGLVAGCSVVYHAAAKILGSDPASYRSVNVDGTTALLDEAILAGVERFVHVSTVGVYGFDPAENITEDAPWPPNSNLYSTTKQHAEKAVWKVADKMPVAVARPGDVVGPQQYAWTVQFVEKIKQRILLPPTDATSGLMTVYVDNLVDALLLIGTHVDAVGQAFNVVDSTPLLTSTYIRLLAKMLGRRVIAVPGSFLKIPAVLLMLADQMRGREATVTPNSVSFLLHKATFSGEKLRSRLGWSPSVSWEEGLRRTEEWLRSAGYLAE